MTRGANTASQQPRDPASGDSGSADPDVSTPGDDHIVDTVWALRWQARYCRTHGAPLAAEVCDAVADDAAGGGPLAVLLPQAVRMGDWVGLRVMGCVHRLAINRQAPGVAVCAPTLGGTSPLNATNAEAATATFRRAVIDTLVANPDALTDALARVPQTNEPGRARPLRVALSHITGPVHLVELGASGGLNLRADHLRGDPALEAGPMPPVTRRVGCDLDPVDITTAAGRTLLSGFVWLDDTNRFADLAHALDVATRVPATVTRADVCDFVDTVEPDVGVTTVVWHSAMWPYLDNIGRQRVLASLDRFGAGATPTSPLWHVSWEPGPAGPAEFELVVRQWDGSAPRHEVWATGDPHGRVLVAASGLPHTGSPREAADETAN